jgi:amino acid transporter
MKTENDDGISIQENTNLKTLSIYDAISMLVGMMIGSGIFSSVGPVVQYSGSIGASLLVWLLAGILSLFGSMVYAELGTLIPESGGEQVYLNVVYGPMMSYIFSVFACIVGKPCALAIIVVTFSEYTCTLITTSYASKCSTFISILVVIVLSMINIITGRGSRIVQRICTVLKTISIFLIALGGAFLLLVGKPFNDNFKNIWEDTSLYAPSYALALYQGLWAYDGWNNLNYVVGEL